MCSMGYTEKNLKIEGPRDGHDNASANSVPQTEDTNADGIILTKFPPETADSLLNTEHTILVNLESYSSLRC